MAYCTLLSDLFRGLTSFLHTSHQVTFEMVILLREPIVLSMLALRAETPPMAIVRVEQSAVAGRRGPNPKELFQPSPWNEL